MSLYHHSFIEVMGMGTSFGSDNNPVFRKAVVWLVVRPGGVHGRPQDKLVRMGIQDSRHDGKGTVAHNQVLEHGHTAHILHQRTFYDFAGVSL